MRAPVTDLPLEFVEASLIGRDVHIVTGLTLTLSGGAPTVLLGPNGSGKSTLLRLAMGLVRPTSGGVTWGGRAAPDERLAMVFQRPVMLRRSAAANVAYALGRRDERRVHELLERVGLRPLAHRPARRLWAVCASPGAAPFRRRAPAPRACPCARTRSGDSFSRRADREPRSRR